MRDLPANSGQVIARIARRQHGVVTSVQLRSAGLTKHGITRRCKAGRLHRLHRGVYAVGHTRLSFEGRCLAAVLAIGCTAAVSHRSAASLWGMLPPHGGPVDVTVEGNGGRSRREGIRLHRSSTFTAALRTRRHGIELTKPRRTLRDLHRTSPRPLFGRAVRKALDLRLIGSDDLRSEDELTRSELERLFRSVCRRHRLPRPELNARVDRFEVDFLWRDRALIVETDGFRHHADRLAFERDRAKDARLQSLGFRVLRFTHRQLTAEPSAVVAALRSLLDLGTLTPDL
jgi:very-short-patch-repair endonuclease